MNVYWFFQGHGTPMLMVPGFFFLTGGISNKFCGLAQYVNLVGITIGYSITSAISMA